MNQKKPLFGVDRECNVRGCYNRATWMVEGGSVVCDNHTAPPRDVVCKHCGVKMISRTDHHAVLGETHKSKCPRRRMYG